MSEISEEDKAFLAKEGFSHLRKTENGGIIGLREYIYTTGLIGDITPSYEFPAYQKRYCYPSRERAIEALEAWDGVSEPLDGWVKYKGSDGERLP